MRPCYAALTQFLFVPYAARQRRPRPPHLGRPRSGGSHEAPHPLSRRCSRLRATRRRLRRNRGDAPRARRQARRQARSAKRVARRPRHRQPQPQSRKRQSLLDVRDRRPPRSDERAYPPRPAGKAGPIVVALGGHYKAKGCTSAPKKTIEAIESNPNAYYVNVHTAKYPNGAIRGQLVAGMVHM